MIGGVKYLIGGKCKECRGRDREDTLTEEGRQMGTYVRKESWREKKDEGQGGWKGPTILGFGYTQVEM